jgi:calmodulin
MSQTEQLSEEQIAEARNAFNLFDQNGDGAITMNELASVLQALGEDASPAEVADLMASADADQNGDIDFPEFLSLMARWKNDQVSEDALIAAFDKIDANADGFIVVEELYNAMIGLGVDCTRADAEEKLREADLDGDGMVTCDEFVRVIMSK